MVNPKSINHFTVGHGLSEGRRADIDQFSHYVEDLIQFVNLIKSEHKSTPIYIMGHNMVCPVLSSMQYS